MSHLDEGTITAWLEGELPPPDAARAESHAASCADCAALVAEVRGFMAGASRIVSSLDVVRGNVIPTATGAGAGAGVGAPAAATREAAAGIADPARPRVKRPVSLWATMRFTPARAAIAATLLVGVASLFSLRHRGADVGAAAIGVAGPAVTAGAPASGSATPAAPAQSASTQPASAQSASAQSASAQSASAASPDQRADVAEKPRAPAAPPAEPGRAAPANVAAPSLAQQKRRFAESARRVDSTVQLAEVAPTAMSAAPKATPAAASALRAPAVSEARVASAMAAEGCYVVENPVGAAPATVLPRAFALRRDSAGRPVILAVDATGRPAGVLAGATWRVRAGNDVAAVFDGRNGPIELNFAPNDTAAVLFADGAARPLRVTRLACR